MTFEEALDRACNEPTMEDALTYIAIWEFERARKSVVPDKPYETCFKHCFRSVIERYEAH